MCVSVLDIHLPGSFFSGITPSASGGQPMQLYYMKRDGIPLPEGTAVLMAVATAYKFVLTVVGMMILLFWQKLLKEHLGGYFSGISWDFP